MGQEQTLSVLLALLSLSFADGQQAITLTLSSAASVVSPTTGAILGVNLGASTSTLCFRKD